MANKTRRKFAIQIDERLHKAVKKLTERDGSKMLFHFERALKNYLKAKKVSI